MRAQSIFIILFTSLLLFSPTFAKAQSRAESDNPYISALTAPRNAESLITQMRPLLKLRQQLLNPAIDFEGAVDLMLYRWAGADKLDPDSRGPHIDARRLRVLEKLLNEPFVQVGASGVTNPLCWASDQLKHAYFLVHTHMTSTLFILLAGDQLFAGKYYYNPARGKFEGILGLDQAKLLALDKFAKKARTPDEKKRFWYRILRAIDNGIGLGKLSPADQKALASVMRGSLSVKEAEDIYTSATVYQQQTKRCLYYVMIDPLYRFTGIQFDANLPIFMFILFRLAILAADSYRKKLDKPSI